MIENGWKIYNEGGKYRILVTKNLFGVGLVDRKMG